MKLLYGCGRIPEWLFSLLSVRPSMVQRSLLSRPLSLSSRDHWSACSQYFPMCLGWFRPGRRLGTAIGNLIGDTFGGTLGPGSIAGFVGNFLLGYLPYTMSSSFFLSLKNQKHGDQIVGGVGELHPHRFYLQRCLRGDRQRRRGCLGDCALQRPDQGHHDQ